MTRRRSDDIPLRRDGTARLLPWLIAPMVYLAALALAGMLALFGLVGNWDGGLAGTMTAELPPAAGANDASLAAALAVLRATPGIARATALDRAAEGKLLEPWLGTSVTPDELQLPRLIDIRVSSDAALDLAGLRKRLAAAAPGAQLDDHQLWLGRFHALALSVESTGLVILAMVGGTSVLTVIFATRAGLAAHRDVIELLHAIGAQDGYIARQFEREALRLGFRGGIAGLILAVITLLGLGFAAAATGVLGEETRLLPEAHFALWQWAALAVLPVAAALTAMATARLTVMRALARLP